MDGSLRSPERGIEVRASERGLPIALKLERRALSTAPTQLARDILLLCQLCAKRMQVARRRDLVARGFSPAEFRGMNLSTEEELAGAEAVLSGNDSDAAPETWMKPI
ncbi:hypothetical protein [Mycobacterium sp. AZCC_0083]|uniref:hypothetical protein n=1 Tax=Mycobacterium sp. AZCC_0083 TaxID=2735882 RepID=UPI00161F87D2|nr:hypothetical protein [Mycobacterium sp. AZCC_0083]MBB5167560.1 hypothetical protein [Mycobacterium sp. AZCC_0083]